MGLKIVKWLGQHAAGWAALKLPAASLVVAVLVLCCSLVVGTQKATFAAPATQSASQANKEGAEHAAEDLVGTPISTIEQKTNANKASIAKQQGLQPGTAHSQKIGAAEPSFSASAVAADPSTAGQWSSVINTEVVPVFEALLPNGKILTWDSVGENATETYPNQTFTRAMVWNPADNTYKRVDVANYNIFCAGFAHLPNGNIFVAGGNKDQQLNGIVQTHIFNWQTESWSRGPDMAAGRWYPSVAAMANGEETIVGGGAATPEVYQTNGTLRALTGLNDAEYGNRAYPWLFSRGDTLLGMFGPYNDNHTANVSGVGAFTGNSVRDGMMRDYGSFAPYDIGKILVAGGGNVTEDGQNNVPTKSALIVNESNGLAQPNSPTSPMSTPRRQFNTTVLADGTVLATGGETSGATSSLVDLNHAATAAELWNPATGNWTTLSSAARVRQYHSTASLLPDGRVLTGGGGICGDCMTYGYIEKNMEYFSPPYLYKKDGSGALAPRPVISNTPTVVGNNLAFTMSVAGNNGSFQKIALVGLSDVTHDVNQGQRYVPLNYTITGANASQTTVTVNGPAVGNVMVPGYYMLFVIDANGVPSVASMVQVAKSASPLMSPVQNAASNRCIDVPGGNMANGTYLWTYDCNGSGPQAVTRVDYDGSMRILGNCLDIPAGNFASGQRIWTYACNGSSAQRWQFNGDGTIRPVSAQGLCLAGASLANQAQLVITNCDGNALQKWNSATLQTPSPQNSPVRNNGSGKCIDVPGSSAANATYLWVYDCNGTGAQSLTLAGDNSLRVLGNCIDVPNGNFATGQRVWTYTCNGTNAQKWQFNADGTIQPTAATGFCLTPDSPANQAQLILYACDGGPLQKWAVQATAPPNPQNSPVKNNGSGQCIDVPGSNTASGTYLWTYACNGSNAQALTRTVADNSLRVLGNCLDVPGGNFASGQRIWTYTCNGTNAQKWQFNADGTIRPTAAQGMCLTPASPANQAQLIIYTCDNGPLQKWNW